MLEAFIVLILLPTNEAPLDLYEIGTLRCGDDERHGGGLDQESYSHDFDRAASTVRIRLIVVVGGARRDKRASPDMSHDPPPCLQGCQRTTDGGSALP